MHLAPSLRRRGGALDSSAEIELPAKRDSVTTAIARSCREETGAPVVAPWSWSWSARPGRGPDRPPPRHRLAHVLGLRRDPYMTGSVGAAADESAWGAVSRLSRGPFPMPLPEPGVRLSPRGALHEGFGQVDFGRLVKGLGSRCPGSGTTQRDAS